MEKYSKYAPVVTRIGLGLVFLYVGISQLINTEMWTGFVPGFLASNASVIVKLNGLFEILSSIMLLVGIKTRIISLLLGLHLLGITLSIGLSPLGVRDFGLSMATLSIFLNGADWLCLERKARFLPKNDVVSG